jgi:hypothetical protein
MNFMEVNSHHHPRYCQRRVAAKYEYRCCFFDGKEAKQCDLRHGQYNRNQGNEGLTQGIYINYSVFDWYSF